jgi:flavin-dependent dehydrogenase
MSSRVDVVIVGARCAGAATALLLARAGARVLVIDKGAHGTDTLSTHALMRGGVLCLHRWGLLPAIVAASTPPVRSTTFVYGTETVTVPIEPRFGIDALYAPRRAILDRILADAAVESGAEVRYGVRADELIVDAGGRVRGIRAVGNHSRQSIEADLVIGADGLHSKVAEQTHAAIEVEGRHAAGVLYSYWEGLTTDEGYCWAFGKDVSLGVIPTNDDATCVFVAMPSSRFHDEIEGDAVALYRRLLLDVSPAFHDRFAAARMVEPVRGFPGHAGFIRRSTGDGWALVGDAGYFKDPLTAHGITDALRDAELLSRAVVAGTAAALAGYETMRNDLSRRLFDVTDVIASFRWSESELQALHKAFSAEMSREVRALANLEPLACRSALASERPAV